MTAAGGTGRPTLGAPASPPASGGDTVYLAAMKSEASALLRRVEGASRVGDGAAPAAVRGRIGDRPVQVAVCGVGERAARRAAERCARLASQGACGRVVWLGIAGALSPDLEVGDLVVGRTVMAPDQPSIGVDETLVGAAAARGCRPGVLVTASGLVVTASSREALWRSSGSQPRTAVDMETWAAARVLQRAGIPFAAVRAISDTAADRLPSWLERVSTPGGAFPLSPVVRGALMRPSALVPLAKIRLRTARLGVRLAEVAASLA
ncbi:MAG: hypothetical protein OXH32_00735 [Acidobacteria bacterium]|nr:hypothetical protein [Acidobacteriota bacterium]